VRTPTKLPCSAEPDKSSGTICQWRNPDRWDLDLVSQQRFAEEIKDGQHLTLAVGRKLF